jgi:hypothetical protein
MTWILEFGQNLIMKSFGKIHAVLRSNSKNGIPCPIVMTSKNIGRGIKSLSNAWSSRLIYNRDKRGARNLLECMHSTILFTLIFFFFFFLSSNLWREWLHGLIWFIATGFYGVIWKSIYIYAQKEKGMNIYIYKKCKSRDN